MEEFTKGRLEPQALVHLVLTRTIKVIAVCLILTLICCLMLLKNYAWLFLSIGAVFGFAIFLFLRYMENRFGASEGKEIYSNPPAVRNLTEPKEINPIRKVED